MKVRKLLLLNQNLTSGGLLEARKGEGRSLFAENLTDLTFFRWVNIKRFADPRAPSRCRAAHSPVDARPV